MTMPEKLEVKLGESDKIEGLLFKKSDKILVLQHLMLIRQNLSNEQVGGVKSNQTDLESRKKNRQIATLCSKLNQVYQVLSFVFSFAGTLNLSDLIKLLACSYLVECKIV